MRWLCISNSLQLYIPNLFGRLIRLYSSDLSARSSLVIQCVRPDLLNHHNFNLRSYLSHSIFCFPVTCIWVAHLIAWFTMEREVWEKYTLRNHLCVTIIHYRYWSSGRLKIWNSRHYRRWWKSTWITWRCRCHNYCSRKFLQKAFLVVIPVFWNFHNQWQIPIDIIRLMRDVSDRD